MRISDLSEKTGVPVPTIKYYLRDGVLFPGRKTARNQADYSDEHVHDLRLIRAMAELGHMPIEQIRGACLNLQVDNLLAAFEHVADTAPTVDQVLDVADRLGVKEFRDNIGRYQRAAQLLENAETEMCADADTVTTFVTALLGDALINALRHQMRTKQ